jgi:DNA-binding transcriptional MerR regulator
MHQTSIDDENVEIPQCPASELATIRQMAGRYGVTLRALRFYEDRGLLKPHRIGAARLYDEVARTRLETILEGKRLGFTLAEIASMLAESKEQPNRFRLDLEPSQILNQIDLLERQRAGLDRAIEELKSVQAKIGQPGKVASVG